MSTRDDAAAPSTDEGEAQWERVQEGLSHSVWRRAGHPVTTISRSLEAAIRAPLEERIRELEYGMRQGDVAIARVADVNAEIQAENERLREALRESIEVIEAYVEPLIRPFKVDEWRALVTPPSSTEGTNTAAAPAQGKWSDDGGGNDLVRQ